MIIIILITIIIVIFLFLILYYYPATIQRLDTRNSNEIHDTFLFRSGIKTQNHPFYNEGYEIGLSVDGVEGKTLYLDAGKIYHIDSDNIEIELYDEHEHTSLPIFSIFAPTSSQKGKELIYRIKNQPYSGGKIIISK